ncbi:structure-specific endonuclease subunit SLX1 isoform X2 [Engraulis encrasicolus]|uniref:structure-specific endonuclease subunit SLX1 isoform X2 n=1 Tax=Engraulis encrasicolus TaxID=184585 RepID=UPI002FD5BAF1
MVDEVEGFFGVYMLFCTNTIKRLTGKIYIGKTVDPERRIDQHNAGRQRGGAKKTSGKGPWEMVLIIHGFPSAIAALRFEWAWQNPDRSRRLAHVEINIGKETSLQFHWRIVSHMLQVAPWNRLPLTVRWLQPKYHLHFDTGLWPPSHMLIAFGAVRAKKKTPDGDAVADQHGGQQEQLDKKERCKLCLGIVKPSDKLSCFLPPCDTVCHLICLAKHFLKAEHGNHWLPVEGRCPGCQHLLLWGNLIRHKNGYELEETARAPSSPQDCDLEMPAFLKPKVT